MINHLSSIVDQFADLKVLVIGEAILESYVKGSADRLSLEAPAPVVQVGDGQETPGGAANTAVHARNLGAEVYFLSVIGKDLEGETLLRSMRARGIHVGFVLRRPDRNTLLRRRVYADSRLLVRYDQGSTETISPQSEDLLLEQMRQLCMAVDVVILSDYGAGILTPRLLSGIARMQAAHPCILVADTRRLEEYQALQMVAVRPSYLSALDLLSHHAAYNRRTNNQSRRLEEPLEQVCQAGVKILEMLNTQIVAITLDDSGALLLERDDHAGERASGAIYRTYAQDMPINRVDGAGDAFVSGLALALAAGAQAHVAAEVASAVAALVVKRGGQATCCGEEVKAYLAGEEKLAEDGAALLDRLESHRQQGRKIVFTNGCFDILHSGHVAYLNQAKSFGDILIIGVNTDESVKRLKGPDRPINTLEERCKVLAGLSCVDFVVPFAENTPIHLIESIQPDIYVKGGDYTRETLPEAPVVEGLGGEVRIVQYVENHSTTGVIQRIRQMYAAR